MKKSKKRFIKLPKYPGGKDAFRKFIEDNLKYPKQALKNNIEGVVYLSIKVNDSGNVVSAKVIKGIGYGCDEEALRLVKMMKYEKVKNRGLRVTSTMKPRINFKIKKKVLNMKYNYQINQKQGKEKTQKIQNKKPKVYNYIIKL